MGKGKQKTGAFSDLDSEEGDAPELPTAATQPAAAPKKPRGHECPHASEHEKAHG